MRILFQGDSITDAGREYGNNDSFGGGYVYLAKEQLEKDFPGKYEMFNRGISGNRIVDLYARIKCDIINVKPDYMSILIGVNDVWHELEQQNGVEAEKFYRIYCMLIEEILEELPDLKITIMEPFALKGTGNARYWDEFRAEVDKRSQKAKEVAEKYGLKFVPLQEKFDAALATYPSEELLEDGVHPAKAGCELLKEEWLKAFL